MKPLESAFRHALSYLDQLDDARVGATATLGELRALCPVTAGLAAPGRLLSEVSFINASGLVRRGAIRRTGLPPLAFFERPEWMRAWFPDRAEAAIDLCRRLNVLLEPTGAPSLPAGVP